MNTTPVERAVTSVALVTTSSHGNQEPYPRETPVKVRDVLDPTEIHLSLQGFRNTCLSPTFVSQNATVTTKPSTVSTTKLSLNSP